jgi:hypothetical protein
MFDGVEKKVLICVCRLVSVLEENFHCGVEKKLAG